MSSSLQQVESLERHRIHELEVHLERSSHTQLLGVPHTSACLRRKIYQMDICRELGDHWCTQPCHCNLLELELIYLRELHRRLDGSVRNVLEMLQCSVVLRNWTKDHLCKCEVGDHHRLIKGKFQISEIWIQSWSFNVLTALEELRTRHFIPNKSSISGILTESCRSVVSCRRCSNGCRKSLKVALNFFLWQTFSELTIKPKTRLTLIRIGFTVDAKVELFAISWRNFGNYFKEKSKKIESELSLTLDVLRKLHFLRQYMRHHLYRIIWYRRGLFWG